MVEEHKDCLKRLRQKERADNDEFFALVSYNQTGELPSADNTTHYPPVIHNGINLMQIPAGASAAKFGRHLGGIMYGKDEDYYRCPEAKKRYSNASSGDRKREL